MLDRFGEIPLAMDLSFLLGVLAQTLSIYTVVLIVRVLLSVSCVAAATCSWFT